MIFKTFTPENKPTAEEKSEIVLFLYLHLENFGDPQNDIKKCVDYALKEYDAFGGFIIAAYEKDEIVSAVVINKTGMKDYIPENILVYIATHNQHRGKGIGKKVMNKAIDFADGNIALHVEPNNPAIKLYEKLGFTNKYLEMRLIKN